MGDGWGHDRAARRVCGGADRAPSRPQQAKAGPRRPGALAQGAAKAGGSHSLPAPRSSRAYLLQRCRVGSAALNAGRVVRHGDECFLEACARLYLSAPAGWSARQHSAAWRAECGAACRGRLKRQGRGAASRAPQRPRATLRAVARARSSNPSSSSSSSHNCPGHQVLTGRSVACTSLTLSARKRRLQPRRRSPPIPPSLAWGRHRRGRPSPAPLPRNHADCSGYIAQTRRAASTRM